MDMCACLFVSVYICSQNVLRLDDSLLPRRLWQAGWLAAGKEGPALQFLSSPLAAAQVEVWLEGELLAAAAVGSRWTSAAGDLTNALLPSAPSQCRVLCCRLCLAFAGERETKSSSE